MFLIQNKVKKNHCSINWLFCLLLSLEDEDDNEWNGWISVDVLCCLSQEICVNNFDINYQLTIRRICFWRNYLCAVNYFRVNTSHLRVSVLHMNYDRTKLLSRHWVSFWTYHFYSSNKSKDKNVVKNFDVKSNLNFILCQYNKIYYKKFAYTKSM